MPLPLTVSCFSKIQIGFTLLVPARPGSPGKGPLNVCVCACVCVWHTLLLHYLAKYDSIVMTNNRHGLYKGVSEKWNTRESIVLSIRLWLVVLKSADAASTYCVITSLSRSWEWSVLITWESDSCSCEPVTVLHTTRLQPASLLQQLTCHMGSCSVACHLTRGAYMPATLVLDLATSEGHKAELTYLTGYIARWYSHPKMVTHPSTNRA